MRRFHNSMQSLLPEDLGIRTSETRDLTCVTVSGQLSVQSMGRRHIKIYTPLSYITVLRSACKYELIERVVITHLRKEYHAPGLRPVGISIRQEGTLEFKQRQTTYDAARLDRGMTKAHAGTHRR